MDLSIYISLGDGAVIGLDDNNNLIVVRTKKGIVTDRINLGPFTPKRAKELSEYLGRLSIHTKN